MILRTSPLLRCDNSKISSRMIQNGKAVDIERCQSLCRTQLKKCMHYVFTTEMNFRNTATQQSLRHTHTQQWVAPTTCSSRTECPASCIRFWQRAYGIVVAPSEILRGSREPGAVSPRTPSQLVPSWYRQFWRRALLSSESLGPLCHPCFCCSRAPCLSMVTVGRRAEGKPP